MKKKVTSIVIAVLLCFTFVITVINVGAEQTRTITSNQIGTHDGYDFELWKDNGTTSMTLNGGGTFSCQWSNINNALFRKGKKFDQTKTHQQLGTISMTYGCDYQPIGNSYLCVYGWTTSPLVEYYIVESWGDWRPPGAASKGKITVDGGTYDVYETTRYNQPSIQGTTTFQQYWSVRTSKRTSGTISISEHFKAWENKGMLMGKMYEVALTVEGYRSSGSANVYSNTLYINGNSITSPAPTNSATPSSTSNPPKNSPTPNPTSVTPTQIPTQTQSPRSYIVTYQLNGGANHNSNPKSYQSTNSYQLMEPTRKGYLFDGWYLDSGLNKRVKVIDKGSKGDINLYAKWKKVTVSKVKINKVVNQKGKKAKITLRKKDGGMDGYEFEYSINRKFPKNQKKVVRTKKPNTTIKKLQKGKTYYFRGRVYKLDSMKNKVYGKWSTVVKRKITK